ncbi:hypothetical protein phytr_11210 [Candidatus Phycorickettsia trachydisci]|uniref:Fido domain-containing protein n=2 Tax=Candidatus Phycorickettsia trachydisci TaxID=2115978 RepID=A0A2P1P9X8_9RICK|nr:hypothetical protein phytr_11210 [Candidatus Phycorickettsia trachydisci]
MKLFMRKTGHYQLLGDLKYFIPNPLPPSEPSLKLNSQIIDLYGQASFALGSLNEMSARLPNPSSFIKAYVIKEALLSSAIEGIHTTLIDVLSLKSANIKPNKDTLSVVNYIDSLETAIRMIQEEKLPILIRVILKAHEALMSSKGGSPASPGQFRKQSVQVGNLVPPPAPEIPRLMSDLEKYINDNSDLPPLIKAGLVHVQFETIHPFLDGNGRIGRLLIVLMLINNQLLNLPILYPSYYFKKHHLDYYQKLDKVRTQGDFEGWIIFYLQAIRDSSIDALRRTKEIENLNKELKIIVREDASLKKMRDTANLVLDFLFANPITSVSEISNNLNKVYNTVHNILKVFIKLNFISEKIVNKRNRIYRFEPYLNLLEKEYDII